jgi:DNA-binding NarL/FixJ family response regulator
MRILIADDHRLIIEGVKLKLRDLGPGVEFVEAETVEQLRACLDGSRALPDVALVDMAMPGAEGLQHVKEAVEALKAHPTDGAAGQVRAVVVLSGTEDPAAIRQVLALGVQGYIPKSSSPDVILNAVRLAVSGGVYVPPEAMKPALESSGMFRPDGLPPDQLPPGLTDRQMDVLKKLAMGKPNKVIARDLGISEGTVKIHLAAIFRALHVRNRLEAVVRAKTFHI